MKMKGQEKQHTTTTTTRSYNNQVIQLAEWRGEPVPASIHFELYSYYEKVNLATNNCGYIEIYKSNKTKLLS